ncbi:MAG TPA: M13 family metallopeptidase [Caulobacterales bacterium]|nr:M13 family metallopeptidase [Caulobacterales bacterium]
MMTMSRRALTASMGALLAGCATQSMKTQAAQQPVAPAKPPAQIAPWGVDLSARDLDVKPGDDFYKYVNGTWLAHNEIPSDRTRWGTFDQLADKSDREVKAIIEEVAATGGAPGTNQQKIADFYKSFLDVDAINAKGLAPAAADLAAIRALRTHEQTVRLMARPDLPVSSPIGMGIGLDSRNPDRYVVHVVQAGLGLPDRDYYLREDQQFVDIRNEYKAHIARMLTLVHESDAAAKAERILAVETQIAHHHWARRDSRDRSRTNNQMTRAQLRALNSRFPWDASFESAGIADVSEVVVHQLSAMAPLSQTFMSTPVSTWRAYLLHHYLRNLAPLLPKEIDDENFAFYGKTLSGQPEQRERWRRGVDAMDDALGEAVGEIYVARHFPPESKAQMQALVENLRRAYGERIEQLAWMSPETKVKAREKLAMFRPKIGYPDRWRDYGALDIRPGDAFGNGQRVRIYQWEFDVARLSKPSDRDEWGMTPQTVNAYYNPVFNEIVFPAAILQPPFFDPNADLAVNYGGIGGVIGHEMGHGFDDQGAKSDGHGVLHDWWNEQDVAAFQALTGKLATQYSAFEPLPDIHVDGSLTLGENIGDNGGLQVSHYAYHLALEGAEAPVLDGVTGEQRFFLNWGQVWRELIRDESLRNQVLSNPHSPAKYRVNGVVRNVEAWYAAFNVQPGDALYLAPADRVLIW